MNATGESDERMYRSTIEQQRATHIIPALEKLCLVVCMSAFGEIPEGAAFKLPPLSELTPAEKAEIIDRRLQPLERLFAVNAIPAESLLDELRSAQAEVDITSTVTDEQIDAVRGKYSKDLAPVQAGPFDGMFDAADNLRDDFDAVDDGNSDGGADSDGGAV